eukprot:TRINITY_DN15815_c0_g1_i1.p1 TRINITY_DN15815_c0_g1~~TRINITY_DN15815_c0_g1_i1.p1  ORF type:complete len:505 (+),score=163.92 TRINITY_DN15815_c0_g1_i1:86-1600(+)
MEPPAEAVGSSGKVGPLHCSPPRVIEEGLLVAVQRDNSSFGSSPKNGVTDRLLAARHSRSSVYSRVSRKSSEHRSAACPPGQRISTVFVFVSMFKFLAGLGMLSVPKAMADLGVVSFVIANTFFMCISAAGCHLLSRTLDLVGREDTDAAELGSIALGRFGHMLAFGSIFLDNWGAVVAYWKAMAGTVRNILKDHRAIGDSAPAITSWWFLIIVFAVLVGPLVLYRRLGQLGWVMHLGNAAIVVFLIAISVEAIAEDNGGLAELPQASWTKDSILAATVIAYAYDCQVNLYFSYRDHEGPVGAKGHSLSKASLAAMVANMITLDVVALSGCAAFAVAAAGSEGSETHGVKDNILNNLSFWMMGVQLIVVVSIIPVVPLLCFENVAMLQDHCLSHWSPKTSNIIGAAIMVVTSAAAAIIVPGLFKVLAYMGSTTAMCQISIIPPLFFLSVLYNTFHGPEYGMPQRDPDAGPAKYPPKWEIAMAVFCLTFGLCAVPTGLWVTIDSS